MPVWNGLTDEFHPTQMIADLLTIRENFGDFQGLNLVFMGDAKNNVANSLMVASAKMGINFTACGPAECMPNDELVATCRAIAAAVSYTHLDVYKRQVKDLLCLISLVARKRSA